VFLATTAISEFWDKDQEILFLGPWCLRYDRRSEWEGLKYQVMSSPWSDRKRFYDAAFYLDECGERMLNHLAEYLNSVHGTSHSQRYWRILLGPWLLHALHVTYDRYVHLVEAFTRYPDLQTIVLDPQSFQVPRNTQEFIGFVLDDPFNLQIFSQLLPGMGYAFPTRVLCHSRPETVDEPEKARWRRIAKSVAKHGVSLVSQVIGRMRGRAWRVGLCELGWSQSAMWSLAWRSGLQALPLGVKSDWSFSAGDHHCDDRRKNLAGLPGSDDFERIFVQSLPQNFPNLYLEAFREAREETLRRSRTTPKVLVSSAGWYTNEPFKFLAAESMERGSRLVTVQHGGGYGIFKFSAVEFHESRIADSYMVWGWADHRHRNSRNLPSLKLSSYSAGRHPRAEKQERMLLVLTAHMRYLLRFHSLSVGVAGEDYFNWQVRFLEAMPLWLRRCTVVRPYLEDYGHRTRERLTERFGALQWDGNQSFLQSVVASRLAVIDHSGTTFLETLRLNVPTILYWDPHVTEVREEAVPYFEDLRKVGILWDSPEAAAKKVAEIYDEPWSWWNSEAVQEVRRRFVDRYAFEREDWVDYWVKALEEEVALSQGREP
jgi:putative transferase (TIGR04331 family)